MDPRELLSIKRDGGALSAAQSAEFLSAYTSGEIADYHAAVLLTSIFIHDMTDAELAGWARGMLATGRTLSFETERPIVDKHSTGGVGDKVSIPLAPALAACGCSVPMISGRGLGHTGGTLDKLESITGLSTEFSVDELQGLLDEAGFFIAAQTDDLVPADKLLYALRDVTGLVASPPLISSSILSKKLAEGLDALVLDIKVGSGSFLTTPEAAADVTRRMGVIAADFDLPITIVQTSMIAPLGLAVGHALEVRESLECLRGGGPSDLRELVTLEGGELLRLVGIAADRDEGRAKIGAALDDGSALGAFRAGVAAQGGDPELVDCPDSLPTAPDQTEYTAQGSGYLSFADCAAVGRAVSALGGGRTRLEDPIDHAVGVVFTKRQGDAVTAGDPLCLIHHRGGVGLDEARAQLDAALCVTPAPEVEALVLDA
jgi:pyrimidine-nucleoside phosphorylase